MSNLVWWTIFVILLGLLIVFTVKLIVTIILDVYCKIPEENPLTRRRKVTVSVTENGVPERAPSGVMNDYETSSDRFNISAACLMQNVRNGGHYSDFERIRLIEANVRRQEEEMRKEEDTYITVVKKNVDGEKKDEESGGKEVNSNEAVDGADATVSRNEERVIEASATVDRNEDIKSVDKNEETIDEANPSMNVEEDLSVEERKILEKIEGIKSAVERNSKEIPYCFGKTHVQYYDINQNLLMNAFSLNEIKCEDSEKLQRRKQMVSMYIRECQSELKKKADGRLTQMDQNEEEEDEKLLEKIEGIRGEVEIFAQQIPYCLGGKNQLQYYEINQNLLLSSMRLGEIDCKKNDTLTKRKQMVSVYIRECQQKLNKKVDNS